METNISRHRVMGEDKVEHQSRGVTVAASILMELHEVYEGGALIGALQYICTIAIESNWTTEQIIRAVLIAHEKVLKVMKREEKEEEKA